MSIFAGESGSTTEAGDIAAGVPALWCRRIDDERSWAEFGEQTWGLLKLLGSLMGMILADGFCYVGVVSEEMIGWIYPASRTDKERTSFPIQDVRCAYRGGGVNSESTPEATERLRL